MKECPRCRIETVLIDYRDKLLRHDGRILHRYSRRCPRCGMQASYHELPFEPVPSSPAPAQIQSPPTPELVQQTTLFDDLLPDWRYRYREPWFANGADTRRAET